MTLTFKKIITILLLASFLTLIFFSFSFMAHGEEGAMSGACPFSAVGTSFCPQDMLALAVHHISSYHTFLNVPLFLGSAMIALFALVFACLTLILSSPSLLVGPPALAYAFSDVRHGASSYRKKIRWLSLLENSPAHY